MEKTKRKNLKYIYSDKIKVVELYKQGNGSTSISKALQISESVVEAWLRVYGAKGILGFEKPPKQMLSVDLKEQVVRDVLENLLSFPSVALKYGISQSAAYQWVKLVKEEGFSSLKVTQQGRQPKDMGRPKKKQPETELEKLEAELRYLRAENAYLKKVRALAQERLLRESGKQPGLSKN